MMTPQLAAVFCLVGLAFAAPSEPEKYIFQEEFDELDYEIWQHERTMSGGGVSSNFHFYSALYSILALLICV